MNERRHAGAARAAAAPASLTVFVGPYSGPGEEAPPPCNGAGAHVVGAVLKESGWQAAFVNIWGGHGGHGGVGGFFVSVSDVLFD
ncbi:hypothetical protein [Kitasatospora herbaricolor]|uniref:hypothetical protein n=1 Tax=Kitasatospora herbaricolor TaxID=68217 RepID=UPI0036D78B86